MGRIQVGWFFLSAQGQRNESVYHFRATKEQKKAGPSTFSFEPQEESWPEYSRFSVPFQETIEAISSAAFYRPKKTTSGIGLVISRLQIFFLEFCYNKLTQDKKENSEFGIKD